MKDNKRKQVRDNERQREDTQRHLLCMYPPPPSTLCRISGWPKSLAERPSPISAAASKASPPTCSQELKPSRRPGRRAGAALRKGELHVETHPHRPHKPGYGILPAEHKRGTAVPRDPPQKNFRLQRSGVWCLQSPRRPSGWARGRDGNRKKWARAGEVACVEVQTALQHST